MAPSRSILSQSMKAACAAIMKEGRAARRNGTFKTSRGTTIQMQTAVALCERFLGKIVVESRHRKCQFLELTEVGRMVALHVIAAQAAPTDIDAWQDPGENYPADDTDREAVS